MGMDHAYLFIQTTLERGGSCAFPCGENAIVLHDFAGLLVKAILSPDLKSHGVLVVVHPGRISGAAYPLGAPE